MIIRNVYELPLDIDVETHPHLRYVSKIYDINGEYIVMEDEPPEYQGVQWRHLRIRRVDRQPIHDYGVLELIKNYMWAANTVAIEVYPRKDDEVDNTNTYHLWNAKNMKVPNLKEMYEYQD